MNPKKKTITSTRKKSASAKKSVAKKTTVKQETSKKTKKKILRSSTTLQIEDAAGSNVSAAMSEKSINGSKSSADSRTQYEKLVNPQNYHEYMRASKFRGNR